ncbi:MAG: hypothetical protein ACRCWJ_19160, partial [Casimicrobium sp.]
MMKKLLKMQRTPVLSALAASLVLAGCAVGPTYVAPNAGSAANATKWYADRAGTPSSVPASEFWQRWNDPSLSTLIDNAMKNATTI